MYCRSCGKELSDNAVACPGCGMDPGREEAFCPACGGATRLGQIMCIACGSSLGTLTTSGATKSEWSTGAYIGLLILSFFLPPFGWIYGGIQASKAPEGSKRKSQAWHYVSAGIAGFILNLIIMGSE
jgi:hypothetical protein